MPNNKKGVYFATAETMFVVNNLALVDIAKRIPVSVRTLNTWKDEGNWIKKQQEYTTSETAFHIRAFSFITRLMNEAEKDFDSGDRKASISMLFAIKGMIACLPKAKSYEESIRKEEEEQATLQIPKEILNDPDVAKSLRLISEKLRGHK